MLSRYIWIIIEGIISIICSINIRNLIVDYINLAQFETKDNQQLFIATIALLFIIAAVSIVFIVINIFKIRRYNRQIKEEKENQELVESMRFLKKEINKQKREI